eukprot:7758062-Lingulodinium_polyedra.AAC.1
MLMTTMTVTMTTMIMELVMTIMMMMVMMQQVGFAADLVAAGSLRRKDQGLVDAFAAEEIVH